jgi:hypothetical protein
MHSARSAPALFRIGSISPTRLSLSMVAFRRCSFLFTCRGHCSRVRGMCKHQCCASPQFEPAEDNSESNARMAAGSISHLVSATTWMRYTLPPRKVRNEGDTHLLPIQPSGHLITPRGRTDDAGHRASAVRSRDRESPPGLAHSEFLCSTRDVFDLHDSN